LRKHLSVALVYNLKPPDGDQDPADELERDERPGDVTAVEAQTQRETKQDTYAEWDTEATILAVKAALQQHHTVSLIEANEEAFQNFLRVRPDFVFNIAEGMRGASREAQIPAILELLGIPYTGSDPLTLALCLDKARTKEILSYHRIPTPAFTVVERSDDVGTVDIPYPLIVKPLYEGSSKGILESSVVRSRSELKKEVARILADYDEPALLEKYLPGREFTVAILGNGRNTRVLPIVEIVFDGFPQAANGIYSYEAKWVWDTVESPVDVHRCPARISQELERAISETANAAFRALHCRDWCRVDIRLDERGVPNVLELNPLPGILPDPEEHSCFPQAARAAGIEYQDLINSVLDLAMERVGL